MIPRTTSKNRTRALDLLSKKSIFWMRVLDTRVDAVVRSESKTSKVSEHLVQLDFKEHRFGDFVDGSMTCDCEAFMYRDGPCKHVLAVAIEAIVRKEGDTPEGWVRSICSESRNTGANYKPWEKPPPITNEIAEAHGLKVVEVKKHRKSIRCYELAPGVYWTGLLPLPENGDRVLSKLPFGEEIPGTIISRFDDDENGMLGFSVELDELPDAYSHKRIVLYGTEIMKIGEDDVS